MPKNVENSATLPRVAVVVSSWHHGNTRKIADAIADELHADVLTVEEAYGVDLTQYDLVGFGSGIYFAKHDEKLFDLIKAKPTLPHKTFLFSTAGNTLLWRLYHRGLRRALTNRGCQVINEFNCPGWDSVGPFSLFGGFYRTRPNNKDLARAREFARRLKPAGQTSALALN
jgi:flavodoxin